MKLNKNMQDGWELKKLSLLLYPYHSSILSILLIACLTAFWHGIEFDIAVSNQFLPKCFDLWQRGLLDRSPVVTVSLFRQRPQATAERDRPPTRSVQYDSQAASWNLPSLPDRSPILPGIIVRWKTSGWRYRLCTDRQPKSGQTTLQAYITLCTVQTNSSADRPRG